MNDWKTWAPAEIVDKFRVSMDEMTADKMLAGVLPTGYDLFQLKYDGWWVAVKILGKELQIITSGADIRKTYKIDNPLEVEALLLGEWMYGTNWSGKHSPGQIFIHDIVHWEFNDMIYEQQTPTGSFSYFNALSAPYIDRLRALNEIQPYFAQISPLLEKLLSYEMDTLQSMWNDTPDYEGVVLKSGLSGLGKEMTACKIKREYTADFVVMGIAEGGGRLIGKMGALSGGQYENGKLVSVCSIGGGFTDAMREEIWNNSANYLGKVFEAKGKGLFKGGALRHPVFSRWREDKLPTQCVRK